MPWRNIARTTLTLDCLVTDCKEQVGNKDMDSAVALANIHTGTHIADTGRH